MTFKLPPLLEQEVETTDNVPLRYRKLQLPFTDTLVEYTSGSCGTFIHQQAVIGDHLYVEQYFEPSEDIELHISVTKPILVLYGMVIGNMLLKYPDGRIFSLAKRRALHYIPANFNYTATIIAGQKYHSIYLVPAVSLLNELAVNYPQLAEPLSLLSSKSSIHQVLPYRKFNGDARKELDKMKTWASSGQANPIYYNNRISDFIISYLEDIHKDNRIGSSLARLVDNLILQIDQHPEKPINVNRQAQQIGLTARALENAFKTRKGTTVIIYVQQQRLLRAKQLIASTNTPIAEIALEVGYTDHSYFSRIFKRATGKTPNEYRRNAH
ncbi:helix-turn-helix domain-containing protein [Chitinophaga sp. CF118]|uniref:helix-turn-helix domain-containing protein n=1 Tax=Chitinophaga sp. CF118 TaxID=1884367 RepID=UPI0015A5D26A|nr:AraC family transcriptional regulator [Chitinophaga sp. CF118]